MKYMSLSLLCLFLSALLLVPQPGRTDITPMDYSPSPSGGVVSPKSPHQTIRLDAQEVIIRLKQFSCTVDAVFLLSNSGATTTEWIGFPKNAMGRAPSLLGKISDFIRFEVSVNDQNVPFGEEKDLMKRAEALVGKSPTRTGKTSSWLMGQAKFPGNATTTIRVSYEASYDHCGMGCQKAVYIYGTGGYWKDTIGKASFIIDSTEKGGSSRATASFSQPETDKHSIRRRLISENVVRYEIRDLEPDPNGSLSVTFSTGKGERDDNYALRHAAMNGRLEEAKALLKKGVDVNVKDRSGETPLMAAAWAGSLPVVKLLLEHGADVNAERGGGADALKRAMSNAWMDRGQLACAKFLMERGAKPTTLPVAAFVGDIDTVRRLAADGINVGAKDTRNEPAPLTAACIGGQVEVVKFLLDKGLKVDTKNEQGQTPLLVASAAGHAELVKVLLDRGADINAKDAHRWSALKHAVFLRGHVEVVKVLLDRGANINARDDPAELTILMHAAKGGHLEVVKLLLERGADVNARHENGQTALSLARGEDIEEIEKVLKARGATK